MKKIAIMMFAVLAAVIMCGCATTVEMVDQNNDLGPAVAGLDYRDFNSAAEGMIASMIDMGVLNRRDGGRYVVAISRVVNETMQYIDTDQLIKKIRVELLRSGRATVTTAVGINGPEDEMAMATRQLRNDAEFNQNTVAGQGQMIAPDLSISGKIIERRISMGRSKEQIEYYFQMTLTDINTGLALWEDEQQIIKRAKY